MGQYPDGDEREHEQTSGVTQVMLVVGVRLYREGLAVQLGRDARLAVVAQCGTADEAVDLVAEAAPDVVLVDIRTPRAFALLRRLHALPVPVPVVAFAVDENEDDIEQCAAAGVAGFATQDVSIDEIALAVLSARCGELTCSPRAAALMLRRLTVHATRAAAVQAPTNFLAQLTAREHQILSLLVTGRSNKAIAAELHIELTTAKNHVHRILGKIGARTRLEAAARVRALTPVVQVR